MISQLGFGPTMCEKPPHMDSVHLTSNVTTHRFHHISSNLLIDSSQAFVEKIKAERTLAFAQSEKNSLR